MKIKSIQQEESCKIYVGSKIICFIPYKDVIESRWAPSGVVISLIDQLLNYVLKSPIISTEFPFWLYILIKNFSKLLIKEPSSSGV